MAVSLFITGATGFIGRHLLQALDASRYEKIYCLTRDKSKANGFCRKMNLQWVVGNILDASVYGSFLASSEAVIHLAAMTGKARKDEYFTVNDSGTRYFVDQCRRRGVKNFLHVSTIAVKYADKAHYHYAQSKQGGEEAVSQSGLNFTIVRPTIVLGKGSPAWTSLSKLARLPLLPVFGDGCARVQPIAVEDLVACLLSVVGEKAFFNETQELGGPEVITIEELLRKIHGLYSSRTPRVVHFRLTPVVRALTLAERYFYSFTPLNAGQLSVFANDGTTAPNPWFEEHRVRMKNVDTILQELFSHA